MATISRTGITGGSTIQPAHVTNIIDALDGTSTTTTVVATGSFTGSLVGALTGTASFATLAQTANTASYVVTAQTASYVLNAVSASFATTASYVKNAQTSSYVLNAVSASYAANVPATASYALTALSSSYAVTASYALNAGASSGGGFPYTGSARITGSFSVTGSVSIDNLTTGVLSGRINGDSTLKLNLSELARSGAVGQFNVPKTQPGGATAGALYWDDAMAKLYIYSEANAAWYNIGLNP